ncbi:acyl-CoA dehydrogenase family protein [Haematobacter massiliensis]|uniref:acyl-CoA dehydrogenase family protein n=1 Tax=Haematobacter massiliensis TaxID=195105 RepID=UPI000A78A4D8|nr:acyl-CoA dehydrogenase family protein [Haematobacter massiliensis]
MPEGLFERTSPSGPLTEEHLALRDTMRDFVAREIVPHIDEWEEARRLPRSLYRKAAEVGLQGLIWPEELGGSGGDFLMQIIAFEEIARAGAGGVAASLGSYSIGLPPIVKLGRPEILERYARPVIAGEKIAALCVTEPGGGSDVAALRTTARRDGAHYVVNGEKTFITSGVQADVLTVAVRTDLESRGAKGISFLVVEGDSPGLSRTELFKMGWHASDTAHLHFADVRVPAENLLGVEHEGFRAAMLNFNDERLVIAAQAVGFAEACLAEARAWAAERSAFGCRLSENQAIRHRLVEMVMQVDAARTLVHDVVARRMAGADPLPTHIARTAMAKITATTALFNVAGQAVQILGGMGYMRGTVSERVFRETKVLSIGGGADEILKDLAARQMGF